jgi:Protein of unknown function (DUF2516)
MAVEVVKRSASIAPVGILFLFMGFLSLALTIWAVKDVASRPEEAFRRAGGRSKSAWLIGLIVGFFIFSVLTFVLDLIYLLAIRPKVKAQQLAGWPGILS